VAKKRFSYELPEKQIDLKCLSHANYKLSLLRDLCLKLGIKLVKHEDREYLLENDDNVLLNKIA